MARREKSLRNQIAFQHVVLLTETGEKNAHMYLIKVHHH